MAVVASAEMTRARRWSATLGSLLVLAVAALWIGLDRAQEDPPLLGDAGAGELGAPAGLRGLLLMRWSWRVEVAERSTWLAAVSSSIGTEIHEACDPGASAGCSTIVRRVEPWPYSQMRRS